MENNSLIKIYVENGSLTKEVKQLNKLENVKLIYFPFENKIKKIDFSNIPSELTWDSTFISFDNDKISFSGCSKSDIFGEIESIIGKNNYNDIRHIDTAYKEGCKIFITPDKDDISSNDKALFAITGIRFFHFQNIDGIHKYIKEINTN